MATSGSSGLLSVRPSLTRSRSNTSPPPSTHNVHEHSQLTVTPKRPSHFRSKSYVSPTERDLQNGATFPPAGVSSEKPNEGSRFPRLHLPGKHQQHHQQQYSKHGEEVKGSSHRKGHRYTQSEAQQYHRNNENHKSRGSGGSGTGHYVDMPPDFSYPSSRGTAIPSLMRMRSYRAGTQAADQHNHQRHGLHRSNSDSRSPTSPELSRPVNAIELQVERADLMRRKLHEKATKSDIEKLTAQVEAAKLELSTRLGTTTRTASMLVRRLDETHNTLHRTAESLVDTLSSFSNLAQQSSRLLSNFDTETSNLNSSIRGRIHKFRTNTNNKRTSRISELEGQGQRLSEKAESLSQRLDNCRVMVRNWETRESKRRRALKDVRNGILWGLVLILVGVFAGVASWKVAQVSTGMGTADQALSRLARNETWTEGSLAAANVPDDVRVLLNEIAERGKNGPQRLEKPRMNHNDQTTIQRRNEKLDKRLRLLDEL